MTAIYLAQSALWVSALAAVGYGCREAYEQWKRSLPWIE